MSTTTKRKYATRPLRVNGWFKITREMFHHPIVGAGNGGHSPYTRFEAWQWLIAHAAWSEGKELKRGELFASVNFLANEWNWTPKMVRLFRARLQAAGMVTLRQDPVTGTTIICVTNYATYQDHILGEGNPWALEGNPHRAEKGQQEKKEELEEEDIDPSSVDCLEAFDLYNATASQLGLAQASHLTPGRKQKLKARLREHGGLEAWRRALVNLSTSAFLRGENDRQWRPNLDFLLAAASFTKLIEGTYNDKPKTSFRPGSRGTSIRDTAESIGDYTRRMIAEGKFKPAEDQ